MNNYTRKDVIIYADTKEAKNYIGKEVYFSDNVSNCLYYANNDMNCYSGILDAINADRRFPFHIGVNDYQVIIPKKAKQKPEFAPFESADEFIEAYDNANYAVRYGTMQNRLLNYGGIWLINNVNFTSYMMVTEVWDDGLTLGTDPEAVTWEELLRDYTFLDGIPCGKIKEEDNNG